MIVSQKISHTTSVTINTDRGEGYITKVKRISGIVAEALMYYIGMKYSASTFASKGRNYLRLFSVTSIKKLDKRNAQMEKEAEQLTAAAKAAYYIEEAIKAFEGKEGEAFAVIGDIRCAMSEGKEIEAQYEEGFPAQM